MAEYIKSFKAVRPGTSLEVQWLGLQASTAGAPGSIPGRGTKILQASWEARKQNKTVRPL